MKVFDWREDVDRRVLGAVRFVSDVDGTPVSGPLQIEAAPVAPAAGEIQSVRVVRNRFGLHVLHTAPGLERYTNSFDPVSAVPARESRIVHLRVTDPAHRFLPADFALRLPRAVPTDTSGAARVSDPLQVRLLPTSASAVADGWCVLRATVWRQLAADRWEPVRGALVRVLRHADGEPLANLARLGRGLTEWRVRADGSQPSTAEALVAVPGIPVSHWNPLPNGPVVATAQAVRIEVRRDPAFDPTDPQAIPDLETLEAGGGGIVAAALAAPIDVRARERRSIPLTFALNGTLQLTQPSPP